MSILYDRSQTIKASVDDVTFTLELTLVPRRRGDLPLPAQLVGDDHPEPRAADVDHRHVLGDVPAALQPGQPVADGAHARRRLRGGRRDRDAREHRSPYGDGKAEDAGGDRWGVRSRVHHPVDDVLARRGVHPVPVHGRHHRQAVPRVRGDDRRGDSRVRLRVADAHADAVEPLPQIGSRQDSTAGCTRRRKSSTTRGSGCTSGASAG